jgi:pyridoxamine 5'-phosphate oxidase
MSILPDDILATFDTLFAEAQAAGEPDHTAMTVATVGAGGRPSARIVLLKAHDARGFVFYTHLDGRKGRELQADPQAALLFHWPRVRDGVQVRIEGDVEVVSDAEADAYFASRARGAQVGAWASLQSQPLESRKVFEQAIADYTAKFGEAPVPRPPHWSGYRVVPQQIEFWQDRPFRLHDRIVFARDAADKAWRKTRLYP